MSEKGATYKYFLATGEARFGYIYDGPRTPGEGRNQIRVVGFETERAAIAALHGATTKQETGIARPITDPNQTLAEFFSGWMDEYARRKLGRKTVERYGQLADYVLPHLGHVAIGKLDLYAFDKIFDGLAITPGKRGKPLSAKTIRSIASVFQGAFKRAVKRYKILKENPVEGCDLPKLHRRNVQTLEPEDIRLFAAQSLKEIEWLRPLTALASATGARRGELLAATWAKIDWENQTSSDRPFSWNKPLCVCSSSRPKRRRSARYLYPRSPFGS